jgi:hypothetical protein
MTTLREAREKGQLDKFISEHEADPPGDIDRLDAAIKRPDRGTAKSDREASTPDSRAD